MFKELIAEAEKVFKGMDREEVDQIAGEHPVYAFQLCSADKAERPGSQFGPNENEPWETILESEEPLSLLMDVCDWLNDEQYPTNEWCRITKNGFSLFEGKIDKTFKEMSKKDRAQIEKDHPLPSRKEMIDALIDHDLEHSIDLVVELLRGGFEGYDSMSDEDIKDQYLDRIVQFE